MGFRWRLVSLYIFLTTTSRIHFQTELYLLNYQMSNLLQFQNQLNIISDFHFQSKYYAPMLQSEQ